MAQSQYAQITDLTSLAITSQAGVRFGNTAMTAALQAASSICDSYLASQFVLPLQSSPQGWDMSLTLAVCNIAAFLLYNQSGFNPNAPADQLIVKRYDDAIAWLKQIRDEEISPQFVDASPTQPDAGPFVDSDQAVGFDSTPSPGTSYLSSFWWC